MKTTIDIADAVIADAKAVAAREKTTVRALVEEGLRRVLNERRARARPGLRRATFRGKGLHPGVAEGSWEGIRAEIYKGRGG